MCNPRNSPPESARQRVVDGRGAARARTGDQEHPNHLPRVLDLGQEVRREAEGERDLGRLVEVRLEDVPKVVV